MGLTDFPPVWLVISAIGCLLMSIVLWWQIRDGMKNLRRSITGEIEENRKERLWHWDLWS